MMVRWTVVFTLAVTLLVSFAVYPIKYDSKELQKEIRRLQRDVEQERVSIDILRAEWSYLTRPGRLKKLAKEKLSLQPIGIESRRIHVADLPYRRVVPSSLEEEQ